MTFPWPLCQVSQLWNTMKSINFLYYHTKRNSLGLILTRIFTRNCSGSLSKDINTCSLGFINGDFPSDRIISLFEITLFSFELLLGILYVVSRSIITLSRMSNATWAVLEFSVRQTWQKCFWKFGFTYYLYEFTPSSLLIYSF